MANFLPVTTKIVLTTHGDSSKQVSNKSSNLLHFVYIPDFTFLPCLHLYTFNIHIQLTYFSKEKHCNSIEVT